MKLTEIDRLKLRLPCMLNKIILSDALLKKYVWLKDIIHGDFINEVFKVALWLRKLKRGDFTQEERGEIIKKLKTMRGKCFFERYLSFKKDPVACNLLLLYYEKKIMLLDEIIEKMNRLLTDPEENYHEIMSLFDEFIRISESDAPLAARMGYGDRFRAGSPFR